MGDHIKELRASGWWDEGDPDSLIWFQIFEGDKILWESSWWDIRDLDEQTLKSFRDEVNCALIDHGLDPKLTEGHWSDWA